MTAVQPAADLVERRRRPDIALLVALRPRQWLKNVLVVGAPLAAGRLFEVTVLRSTALAFVAFCLAASSCYLVNDVHDAVEDRGHPRKRLRPVASGELAPRVAIAVAAMLAVMALGVAALASRGLAALVAGYLALTLAYTLRLRREPVLEMVVVATGFIARAAAGGVAAGIPVSSWFLLVAGFGSLFLVSGKRYAELVSEELRPVARVPLAAYSQGFLRFVWTSSATVTLIAYASWADQVYVVRDEGSWALWSLLPFLLIVLRYALDIDRGRTESPEDVLTADHTLQVVGLIWLALVLVGAGAVGGGG